MTNIRSSHVRVISTAFAAGVVGGIVNFLFPWILGRLRIPQALHVDIHPDLHKADLYQKAFWGGIWGFAILFPWRRVTNNWWARAALVGALPSLVQIFIVFPHGGQEIGGVRLGNLTPAFVFLFNIVGWAMPSLAWFTAAGYEDGEAVINDLSSAPLLD